MASYDRIILKKGKEEPLLRFHPWLFSGAIRDIKGKAEDGDTVEVFSNEGSYLATGHYQGGSIAAKLFTFQRKEINRAFWKEKFQAAFELRKACGIISNQESNSYRLIHNEGDGMPGLIVDVYNDIAVFQAHSVGMHNLRKDFASIILELFAGQLKTVFDKSSASILKMSGLRVADEFLYGSEGQTEILESGCSFLVDAVSGQKTGFFLDQRINRSMVTYFSKGRNVLNLFGYTGGFSIYAAKAGAALVHTVDISSPAMDLCRKNFSLNKLDSAGNEFIVKDAWQFLESAPYGSYDLIILDPPAYAKSVQNRRQALKGYRNINALALKKIASGGILFTFSCSQVVDRQMFVSAITAAAVDSGRKVQVLHQLGQPPDHPVSIYHQEGEYLKGLILRVE